VLHWTVTASARGSSATLPQTSQSSQYLSSVRDRAILSIARVSCSIQDTRLSADATFSQPLSAVVRSTSPTVKYLQGIRTAPRPIRQSRSSARELARNRLVRPTLYASAWALQRIPQAIGARLCPLRLLVVAQYSTNSHHAWLASCGVLLTALACGRARLQPRGIASALLYYSPLTRFLCVRPVLCDRGVCLEVVVFLRLERLLA
jgi:hypothetical protein